MASSPPPGAPLSEDGNYWWDETASEWKLVSAAEGEDSGAWTSGEAEVGTRSEDGNYWWDGTSWQSVSVSDESSGTIIDPDEPMDWSQFPEIARVVHYGEDIDAYLLDLGIDPSIINDDEANV